MGTQPLRIVQHGADAPAVNWPLAGDTPPRGRLGALLLGLGQVTPDALGRALARQRDAAAPLGEILIAEGAIDEATLFDALALQFGTDRIDPADYVPDVGLIDSIGAGFCAMHGVIPVARAGATTVVATCEPARFDGLRPVLERQLGPVSMVLACKSDLHRAVVTVRQRHLATQAELRCPDTSSCRSLSNRLLVRGGIAFASVLGLAILVAPLTAFSVLSVLALFVLGVNTVFAANMAVLWLGNRTKTAAPLAPLRPVPVSIMVPLFKEKHIAERLVHRLARLDYPVEQLEILLVIEEDDPITRATLETCALPTHMRTVLVPRGCVQTKPRALNYALDFCRGHIVGVYDAEDAPDPGQIRAVVGQFQRADPVVACLQGRLDYYNPRKNWMARCFTVEYATWFRVMLPGLARLGLPVPLGGTTLFFRKSALVSLGGWDAHNVTEDADLGLRLARRGYRTALLDSVTLEEANCRPWPWVRQRSRWIKGYAMTYFVHMRDPRALWRDLGARGFWGMQILFLGSMLGVLTAPLLWSFALITFGLPHPWSNAINSSFGDALTWVLAVAVAVHWSVWGLGAYAKGDKRLILWAPTLSLYHMLATAAALKAAFEIVTKPFFWDKTTHGHLSETGVAPKVDPAAPQPP